METINAIIVAGGSGARFGSKKQFMLLADEPVIKRTVAAFDIPEISRIIVVVPEQDVNDAREIVGGFSKDIKVISGGPTRQASVLNGLKTADHCDIALIHDGVRPFATRSLIQRVIDGVRGNDGCIPAVSVTETIKESLNSAVIRTVPRENLFAIQTPQAFKLQKILEAHESDADFLESATDDSMLIEKSGGVVKIVEGERFNIKITLPEDMIIAEAIYAFQSRNRV